MSIFQRLFKVGQAESNALIDKLEDPIKMTEQGIRDLKKDLDESLKAFAEVKSLSIRARKESNDLNARAKDYEQKAMALIRKAESGQIDANEADRLASEALVKKQESEQQAVDATNRAQQVDSNLTQLDTKIKKLRSQINHYENELKTLKARAKVSDATTKLNKQMSKIDGGGTISMLEKMKDRVAEKESLSEAYSEIADTNKSLDEEIDSVIGGTSSAQGSDALAALKAKMKGDQGHQ